MAEVRDTARLLVGGLTHAHTQFHRQQELVTSARRTRDSAVDQIAEITATLSTYRELKSVPHAEVKHLEGRLRTLNGHKEAYDKRLRRLELDRGLDIERIYGGIPWLENTNPLAQLAGAAKVLAAEPQDRHFEANSLKATINLANELSSALYRVDLGQLEKVAAWFLQQDAVHDGSARFGSRLRDFVPDALAAINAQLQDQPTHETSELASSLEGARHKISQRLLAFNREHQKKRSAAEWVLRHTFDWAAKKLERLEPHEDGKKAKLAATALGAYLRMPAANDVDLRGFLHGPAEKRNGDLAHLIQIVMGFTGDQSAERPGGSASTFEQLQQAAKDKKLLRSGLHE